MKRSVLQNYCGVETRNCDDASELWSNVFSKLLVPVFNLQVLSPTYSFYL